MRWDDNIFAAPTKERAAQVYNTVSNRVRSLPQDVYAVFENGDIATQKIIVLIAIMRTDTLFFDFMYEVYREKLILGDHTLSDSDIRVFFKNKQTQSARAAEWKDCTLKRLSTCYKTILVEAGAAARIKDKLEIIKPVLDTDLQTCLAKNHLALFVHVLTGGGER